jgi:hypothetical protein
MGPTISSDANSANAAERPDSRLAWYFRRLAAMSAPEMAFRLLDRVRLAQDKRQPPRFDVPADIGLPIFPALAGDLAQPDSVAEWRMAYDDARAGKFAWFGVSWPNSDRPDWHLDPASGQRWPADMFGPDIGYRHDNDYGDVKLVWELNRLQYLQPVAALAHVTGEAGPADLVRRHIADWIARNPPFLGINWASGIELALRAVSLIFAGSLVDLGEDLRTELAKSLSAHGYFLARYPSRYSSANNHAVAEGLGLLAIGTALPALPDAADWARQGRAILERESVRQILPDGVGAEQAIAYQGFTMEMLALGAKFGAATLSRFPQAEAFLEAITDASGNMPRIGDDDEGRVFLFPSFPRRRESIHPAAPGPEMDSRLRGNDDSKIHHFPIGGYTAVREGPMLLVFDHGPLGYLSIAAHGHADALSIWLHVDGQPLLVDAGTYRYHGAGRVRDAFRGTAAHNTLTVAGADQSEIAGPFNWSRKANCRVLSVRDAPWAVEAEHDGYVKRFGCRHRRRIESAGPLRFSVIDTLIGTGGPWPVGAGFLVAPGNEVRYEDGIWLIGGKLRLNYKGPLQAKIQEAEYSPSMGRIEPTLRLVFHGPMSASDLSRFDFSLA